MRFKAIMTMMLVVAIGSIAAFAIAEQATTQPAANKPPTVFHDELYVRMATGRAQLEEKGVALPSYQNEVAWTKTINTRGYKVQPDGTIGWDGVEYHANPIEITREEGDRVYFQYDGEEHFLYTKDVVKDPRFSIAWYGGLWEMVDQKPDNIVEAIAIATNGQENVRAVGLVFNHLFKQGLLKPNMTPDEIFRAMESYAKQALNKNGI